MLNFYNQLQIGRQVNTKTPQTESVFPEKLRVLCKDSVKKNAALMGFLSQFLSNNSVLNYVSLGLTQHF